MRNFAIAMAGGVLAGMVVGSVQPEGTYWAAIATFITAFALSFFKVGDRLP
jgi:hypothetical protein